MRKITDENMRHISTSIMQKHINEAKELGFSSLDAYIEYLQIRISELQAHINILEGSLRDVYKTCEDNDKRLVECEEQKSNLQAKIDELAAKKG